jgi:hypothetical protein
MLTLIKRLSRLRVHKQKFLHPEASFAQSHRPSPLLLQCYLSNLIPQHQICSFLGPGHQDQA